MVAYDKQTYSFYINILAAENAISSCYFSLVEIFPKSLQLLSKILHTLSNLFYFIFIFWGGVVRWQIYCSVKSYICILDFKSVSVKYIMYIKITSTLLTPQVTDKNNFQKLESKKNLVLKFCVFTKMQNLVNLKQSADHTYFITWKRNRVNCLLIVDSQLFSTEFCLEALVTLTSIISTVASFVKVQVEGWG